MFIARDIDGEGGQLLIVDEDVLQKRLSARSVREK